VGFRRSSAAHSHSNSDCHADSCTNADTYVHNYSITQSDSDGNVYSHCDRDAHTNGDADAYSHSNTQSDSDGNVYSHCDCNAHSD